MIFLAIKKDNNLGKTAYLYSDKSQFEMKQFVERGNLYFYRMNTSKLGLHYVKEISERDMLKINKLIDKCTLLGYEEWENSRVEWIKSRTTSNIKELEKSVEEFLQRKYEFFHFQKEYTHTYINVRADFFGVTKERKIVSVELKSDKDTIARLEKQLRGYKDFSHIVYVATDVKHLSKVEKLLRDIGGLYGVGLLVYENGTLYEESKPYLFEHINAKNVLWKKEYQDMLWGFSIKGKSKLSVDKLEGIARNIFTVLEFDRLCEYLFIERYAKAHLLDNITSLYQDQEHKQMIIERLSKKK